MCNALSKWQQIKSFCRLCKQILRLVKAALMNLGYEASARRSLRIRRIGQALQFSSNLDSVSGFLFSYFVLPTLCVGNFCCLCVCEHVCVYVFVWVCSCSFASWAHGKRQVNISISTTAGAASAACQVTCNLWQANKNKHELMLLTHIVTHTHRYTHTHTSLTYTCVTQISCT